MNRRVWNKIAFAIIISLLIAASQHPAELEPKAWHLFAIFVGTITLIVTNALPMGACALIGICTSLLCKTLTFTQAFGGFTSSVPWLILCAFFISYGLVHSGLGKRIALFFIAKFGKSPMGIAYSIGLAELVLAPGTPSSTARTGGIIFPILDSIARSLGSFPHEKSRQKIGAYLTLCLFNFTVVSSAMFLTSMAANPFAAQLSQSIGINISWSLWAKYAVIPGLISIILGPILIYKILPPSINESHAASNHAKENLLELGPMKNKEKLMALIFILLISAWIFGPLINISAIESALIGVILLLFFGIATWEQLLKLHSSVETFLWFGFLFALAEGLNKSGFTSWFGSNVSNIANTLPMWAGILVLFLIYFYSHYFFASCTAHVGALFLPFLSAAITLSSNPLKVALMFCFGSSLMGSLTHYGIGPGPILFGSGYVTLKEWWLTGFLLSVMNLIIWAGYLNLVL